MRRLPRRRRVGGSVVLLLFFAASHALSQDYESDFRNGLRARDHGSWKEAITYFKKAADARPQEGTERISTAGTIGYPYLPHYYLGEAYANSGNCEAALEELDTSEKQGFVQKAGKLKDLLRLRANCAGKVARVATPRSIEPGTTPTAIAVAAARPTPVAVAAAPTQRPQPSPTENALAQQSLRDAQTEVARAEAVASDEARLREGSIKSGGWQKDPSLEAKEKRAKNDLTAARAALEEGKARGDVPKLRAARDDAARASQEFGALQRILLDSQRIASQVTPAPPPLPKEVNARIGEARQRLAEAGRNPSLPAEAAAAKAKLEVLLRDVQKLPSATPSEIKGFDARLKIATASLAEALKPKAVPTPAAVPPTLLEGASAYFAGDYASAARTLTAAPDFPDRRAAAEARLFRSAARYALYVIGGAKDGTLQQAALQDVSDCRRLDPRVSPNPRVFSPRFVEFFTASAENGPRPSR